MSEFRHISYLRMRDQAYRTGRRLYKEHRENKTFEIVHFISNLN